ncbi:hypothetical protein AAE478_009586 [Parahypoxylon ruwenzoriense]
MLKIQIATAALLGRLAVALAESLPTPSPAYGNASYDPRTESSGVLPCEALKDAGLGDRLLFATDPGYEPQIATWFAENARLRPFCLVLPHNSEEVSTALTALVSANDGAGDWHIAVRSGGHGAAGFSNIDRGVTIDLSMMNSTSYDQQTNLAKIEPGGRWRDVYADLEKQGVTVAGGRDGDVGVGGFLLGGGNSFFSGRLGFGCDSVMNFEVVLVNGTIINANSTNNRDLWKALKGGGSNFGIVTRFDMEAVPTRDLYYDLRFLSSNHSNAVVDAVVGFSDHDQSFADNALVVFYSHDTSVSPDIYIGTIYVNTVGNGNATTAFTKVKELPALFNHTVLQNMAEAANGSQLAGGTSRVGTTLTFRNNPEILRRCVELHEDFVQGLKRSINPDNFASMLFFQPIPFYMGTMGKERGGNMLGLDAVRNNAIMWTAGVAVDSDEGALAIAQAELNVMTARVKELSRSTDGDMDFIFLNYAEASQDPLGSYGLPNIQHMRNVASTYDPTGIFQRRVPGGFKISRVIT